MLQIGLRLHDGEALPLEQLLPLVRAKGFSCVHMALSKSMAEYPFGPSALTAGYAGYLRRQFAKNELDIAVLGNYLNLADPDEAALSAAKERYYAHIRFAALLGCGMVGTETGAPNSTYTSCPECRSDAALAVFIRNLKDVVRCAERYGVTIAIEPVARHIVWNAKRCRQVLDEIGSPNLQILFDPVNLLDETNVDARGRCGPSARGWAKWITPPSCALSRRKSRLCTRHWRTQRPKTPNSAVLPCRPLMTRHNSETTCTQI